MAVRRKPSRIAAMALAGAAALAVAVYFAKPLFSSSATQTKVATNSLHADQPGPQLASQRDPNEKTPATKPASGAAEQSRPDLALVSTTQPAAKPVDLGPLMTDAKAKLESGDLVTARDRVNAAIADGSLGGEPLEQAKQFVAGLNEKIIFGTQKFPADPYNTTWKVEPGTALWKLAKRFDVTAELLCRVNGLKDASKLRAGVTIKAIQGPFHLVVSKHKFTADLYLGAPGGAGSMYLKTFKVGLGSDNSTPTGTWIVDTGKVVNPVYYSSRGEGTIAADDPKNPLGERWMPLKGIEGACVGQESYGIHGTIDPSSIGKNMSMGCIRLLDADITELYDLLVEQKSKVRVVD